MWIYIYIYILRKHKQRIRRLLVLSATATARQSLSIASDDDRAVPPPPRTFFEERATSSQLYRTEVSPTLDAHTGVLFTRPGRRVLCRRFLGRDLDRRQMLPVAAIALLTRESPSHEAFVMKGGGNGATISLTQAGMGDKYFKYMYSQLERQ